MDNVLLLSPISPPMPVDDLGEVSLLSKKFTTRGVDEITEFSEDKKKQIAKDFESVLLTKLLDGMKNTIGNWGLDKDSASEQVQGIFWLYLARDIANQGGLGLWKDIYEFVINGETKGAANNSVSENI